MLSNQSDMYSGYQQQDAQEFLSILLDTLHEDLNQGDIKKNFEMPDGDGKPDDLVARESWNFHKQRNLSYFVDTFLGQYKSKVSCLACAKVSITFDPYMYLSLPLAKDKTSIEFCYLECNSSSIARCKVYSHLPVNSNTILNKIAKELKLNKNKLSMYTISKTSIIKDFTKTEVVSAKDLKEQLIVQEQKFPQDSSTSFYVLYTLSHPLFPKVCSFCNRETDLKRCTGCKKVAYCGVECQTKHRKTHRPDCVSDPMVVGIPLIVNIRNKDLSYSKVLQILLNTNVYVTLNSKQRTKLKSTLKVGDMSTGKIVASKKLSDYRANDFVALSKIENACIMVEYDNPNREVLGVSEFDVYEHENMKSRTPQTSLGDCFFDFTQEEKLPDTELWKCPKCRKLQKATKQISLYSCPNYLIIHLKRFQARNIIMYDKTDKDILFPIRSLDLAPYSVPRTNVDSNYYLYDLFGVANHYGSLYRGHYTAYARLSGSDNIWREFDDRTVTSINENSVQSEAAYVLFYKRRSFSEDISRGILSSEDEEFYDAEGPSTEKESDELSDNSCYSEAKVYHEQDLQLPLTSEQRKCSSEDNFEVESHRTAEVSSSSDLSCDYVKVGSEDGHSSTDRNASNETERSESDLQAEKSNASADQLAVCTTIVKHINFEDELD